MPESALPKACQKGVAERSQAAQPTKITSLQCAHTPGAQAVAAARLAAGTGRSVRFVGRLGNDSHAAMLQDALVENGVDVSGCGRAPDQPSGHGIVLLEPDGAASSVVLAGSNAAWPEVGTTRRGGGGQGIAAFCVRLH